MENILPTEIVLDIFSCLPAELVLRCRRVCKAWQSLLLNDINNNNFVNMHLRRQLQQLDDDATKFHNHFDDVADAAVKFSFITLIEIEYCKSKSRKDIKENIVEEDYGVLVYYGECDEKNKDEQSYRKLTMINHPPLRCNERWVGSCNGLICLSSNHHDINDPVYIFNPLTRECSKLPLFTELTGPSSSAVREFYKKMCRPEFGYMMSGFGYNSSRNEYKVVRIYYADDYISGEERGCVEVYTLGSGTGWRSKGETTYRVLREPGVFANGALHWLELRGRIVAFDLADEKFRVLPSPSFVENDCHNDMYNPFHRPAHIERCTLCVLGGCFCISYLCSQTESIYIWSFKKNTSYYCVDREEVEEEYYESSWTWTKEFSIIVPREEGVFLYPRCNPFALTKNGRVLLWIGRSILACYDRKTATLRTLMDYAEQGMSFQKIPHINSLVSLKTLGEDSMTIVSVEEREYSDCPRTSIYW